MSHALALGQIVPFANACLRRCDDRRNPTWVPNADGDALWVVCSDCRREQLVEGP